LHRGRTQIIDALNLPYFGSLPGFLSQINAPHFMSSTLRIRLRSNIIWKTALIVLQILICSNISPGQDSIGVEGPEFQDSTLRVGKIFFVGNEITKDYIIAHAMSLKPGSVITHEAIEYDINRIYSLRLFNKVDIHVLPDSTTADLMVVVNERWFFYPFPIAGIKDHLWSRLYYGAGVVHTNFGGRDVQINGQFALGYDPYVSLLYYNPFIDRDNDIYFTTKFYYTVLKNQSLVSQGTGANFDERWLGGYVGAGKQFSLFTTIGITLEYDKITVSNNEAGRTISPDGTDRFFSLNASYQYNTCDFGDYPSIGTLINAGVSKLGLWEKPIDYQRYNIDVRRYIPMWYNIVLAARAFGSFAAGGTVPNYGHVFFGYNERIRGHFNTILEGEDIAGGAAELHFPIISPNYIRIEQIPVEQFRDIRYALYFALFANTGTTWYRHQPVAIDNFLSGYGAGFHFLVSYSVVFRLEYAFGGPALKNGELIFDLGAAL
jgi:outer membrane protein assembly factor BamA